MFKLLIFDLDGTLIDSARDIASAMNALLTQASQPPQPEAVIVRHIGEGLRHLMQDFFPHLSPTEQEQQYTQFIEIYGEHCLRTTKVFPGVTEFLQTWPGHIAVVTNKPAIYTTKVMQGLGLDRFDWVRVFGADSLPRRKPDPLPLIETMRAAQCEPFETVMIGDGSPDIRAALSAGVTSIAIEFGYTPTARLIELGAHATLPHFDELPRVLKQVAGASPKV